MFEFIWAGSSWLTITIATGFLFNWMETCFAQQPRSINILHNSFWFVLQAFTARQISVARAVVWAVTNFAHSD